MTVASAGPAFGLLMAELHELLPDRSAVIDAHTHLGHDEDGQSLQAEVLLGFLDQVHPQARACVFALHDPDRHPAYRIPNDRILAWAGESGGRLIPFCRLDPAEQPVAEAQRCVALGARGIKLHPRAQAFSFDSPAARSIFEVARDAGVPILIHAGRGMPSMDALADLALRYPEVGLVLAHAAVADQGMFASRLADHPRVVYDTSWFSPTDLIELFARVPAERIVFASDVPYGRPAGGLFATMRIAAHAGLGPAERAAVAGHTIAALVDGRPLAATLPPRLPQQRLVNGRLARVDGYLMMAFAGAIASGPPPDPSRALQGLQLARAACRDPDPGAVGPVLERVEELLATAEQLIIERSEAMLAFGLIIAAAVIAATETGL
jgi:predicted TIM-barrel fold metal-dependent hydrolase